MGLGTVALFAIRDSNGGYDTVAITQCLTKDISVEPHTDASGRNEVASRVVINFSGQLSAADSNIVPAVGKSPIGSNPGTGYSSTVFDVGVGYRFEGFMNLAARMSTVDLGEFKYVISDSVVAHVASYPDNISASGSMPSSPVIAAFGVASNPQPGIGGTPKMKIKAHKVVGEMTMWVDVEVEMIFKVCDRTSTINGDDYKRNIKSLRWWYSDDIDGRTWLNRRLFRGRLELWNKAINPHIMRFLVLPPLSSGYKRDSIRLSESEDGLSLDFEIVDIETIANPPFPACEWDGDVSIKFPKLFAGPVNVSMNCSLTGTPGVNKIVLANLLVRVLDAKLDWFDRVVSDNRSVYTMGFEISESITRNQVDGRVELMFIPKSDQDMLTSTYGASLTAIVGNIFGNNMSYNPNRTLNFSGGTGAPDPSIPPYSLEFGHDRGIRGYDPIQPTWAYPSSTSTRGILYNALMSTQCSRHFTPQESAYLQEAYYSGQTVKSPDQSPAPPPTPPSGGNTDTDSGEKLLTKLDPDSASPYMSYKISTSHSQDMGLRVSATNAMYQDDEGGVSYGNSFVTQTRSPTNIVKIRMEASRLNKWPNFPNELNWKDDQTGIYYFCKDFNIEANGVSPSVVGDKLLYSGTAEVTYATSRPVRHNEAIRVSCAPFISAASADATVQANVSYIECEYRKPGENYVPGDVEDIECGTTDPPAPPDPEPPTPER